MTGDEVTADQVKAWLIADLNRLTVEELVEEGFDVQDAVRFKAAAARVSSGSKSIEEDTMGDEDKGIGPDDVGTKDEDQPGIVEGNLEPAAGDQPAIVETPHATGPAPDEREADTDTDHVPDAPAPGEVPDPGKLVEEVAYNGEDGERGPEAGPDPEDGPPARTPAE